MAYITHLGESLDLSTVAGSTLAGEETKRTVTGGFVLSRRSVNCHLTFGVVPTNLTVTVDMGQNELDGEKAIQHLPHFEGGS